MTSFTYWVLSVSLDSVSVLDAQLCAVFFGLTFTLVVWIFEVLRFADLIWRIFETKTFAINFKVHNVCRCWCKHLDSIGFCDVVTNTLGMISIRCIKLIMNFNLNVSNVQNAVECSKTVSLNQIMFFLGFILKWIIW